jgi:molybdopterin-guanine dinucleotide biosynthesis protein A
VRTKKEKRVINGVYGIVLCGGESKRMRRSKALLEVGGVAMLTRVCKAVSEVAKIVVVVSARGQVLPALPPACWRVDDEQEQKGPLSALSTGVHALGCSDGHTFVVGCDYPFLTGAYLRALLGHAGEADLTVDASDHAQPLCAWYRTECLTKASDLIRSGEYRLRMILKGLSVSSVPVADLDAWYPEHTTFNINTPEEHAQAEEIARL